MGLGACPDATETLTSTEIRCLYIPVRNESLYRLRDPGRNNNNNNNVLPVIALKTKPKSWPSTSLQGRYSWQLNQSSIDKEASHTWLKRSDIFPETDLYLPSRMKSFLHTTI